MMRIGPKFVVAIMALAVAGCTRMSVTPYAGDAPRTISIQVIVTGEHSELALSAADSSGPLSVFRRDFPAARYIVFGWGERAFYMTRQPSLAETLRAALPAPSVLFVAGLVIRPKNAFARRAKVFSLQISRPGLDRLQRYIGRYIATGSNGQPQRLQSGRSAMSAFFASSGKYDLFHTCNTWTAEALRVAGVPISARSVILAGQLVDRLQGIGNRKKVE